MSHGQMRQVGEMELASVLGENERLRARVAELETDLKAARSFHERNIRDLLVQIRELELTVARHVARRGAA